MSLNAHESYAERQQLAVTGFDVIDLRKSIRLPEIKARKRDDL